MAQRYSRNFIEKIRAETDLVIVVSEFIVLKKSGGWTGDYTALCPFHKEETSSFRIITRKEFYRCYGCGRSGDVFEFIMKINGFSFMDSVKYLGKRAGLL